MKQIVALVGHPEVCEDYLSNLPLEMMTRNPFRYETRETVYYRIVNIIDANVMRGCPINQIIELDECKFMADYNEIMSTLNMMKR